jgi:hypothetical protein
VHAIAAPGPGAGGRELGGGGGWGWGWREGVGSPHLYCLPWGGADVAPPHHVDEHEGAFVCGDRKPGGQGGTCFWGAGGMLQRGRAWARLLALVARGGGAHHNRRVQSAGPRSRGRRRPLERARGCLTGADEEVDPEAGAPPARSAKGCASTRATGASRAHPPGV